MCCNSLETEKTGRSGNYESHQEFLKKTNLVLSDKLNALVVAIREGGPEDFGSLEGMAFQKLNKSADVVPLVIKESPRRELDSLVE